MDNTTGPQCKFLPDTFAVCNGKPQMMVHVEGFS